MTFTGMLVEQVAREVKKPIEAIQCANTFGLLQRKMYNVLLANAAGHLRPDVTHRITIGTLCNLMGYKSRDYDTIKNRFRELRKMDIEWDIINEHGNKVWTNTSPLSLARVIEGEGICEYEFTKGLLPYLDRPAQYAKFSLAIQSKFKSSYGLALYENCERYRKIGYTKSFDIPTFRKLMGIKDAEYREFFAMKRRVIDKAVAEVNTYADFEIDPAYEKSGKQTIKIKFLIKIKSDISKVKVTVAESTNDEIRQTLIKTFGLDKIAINKLFETYDLNYIQEKIKYVMTTGAFQKGKIDNLGAYLTAALSRDYKTTKSNIEVIREIEFDSHIIQQKKRILDCAQSDYDKYLSKYLVEKITKDKLIAKDCIESRFSEYLKTLDMNIYNKFLLQNFSSGIVMYHLKNYIKEYYPEIIQDALSCSEYIKQYYPSCYEYYITVS